MHRSDREPRHEEDPPGPIAVHRRSGGIELFDFCGFSVDVAHPIRQTTTVTMTLGAVRTVPVVSETGLVEAREGVDVTATFDHRVARGVTVARFLRTLSDILEAPENLV